MRKTALVSSLLLATVLLATALLAACSARAFREAATDAGVVRKGDASVVDGEAGIRDASAPDAAVEPITLDGTYVGQFSASLPWRPDVGTGSCDIDLSVALTPKATFMMTKLASATRMVTAGTVSTIVFDSTFSGIVMSGTCRSTSAIALAATVPLVADPRAGAFGLYGQADGEIRDTTNGVSEPVHIVVTLDATQFASGGQQPKFQADFTISDPHFVGTGSFGGRALFGLGEQ